MRVRSKRLVSFTQRGCRRHRVHVVEPADASVRLIVQSELVANELIPPRSGDPRMAGELKNPAVSLGPDLHAGGAVLLHATRLSGLQMAAGMDHPVEAPVEVEYGERGDGGLGADYIRLQPRPAAV